MDSLRHFLNSIIPDELRVGAAPLFEIIEGICLVRLAAHLKGKTARNHLEDRVTAIFIIWYLAASQDICSDNVSPLHQVLPHRCKKRLAVWAAAPCLEGGTW